MNKICFIIDSIKNSGGRERVISLLSNEFSKENDIYILVLDDCNKSFYKLEEKIKIINLNGKNKIDILVKLNKFFKVNKEMIYITLSMRYLNLFVGVASTFTNSKIIATEHCDYFTTPKLVRGLKRVFYKNFKYVVTLTEKDRDIIKKWFDKCIQINNPCSFKGEKVSKYKNKILLNVGRLTEQKGQDMLLKAWSLVNKQDWKLRIVGDGELKTSLINEAKELNISDSVEFVNPTKNIEEIYAKADIFVLSSRWEGLPMVLIEAMSCGLPCISFDCETGPRQLISNKKNGFLVEPNNIRSLSNKIQYLIENENRIIEMGKNSIEKSKEFDICNISHKWYELIEKINVRE